ncbi:MAG: alpha/beta hydrolase [Gammaproteobacteria bacterium]
MPDLLPRIEIEPATPATASIIWLHGLGANGHDFEPIVPELRLPQELAIRFIFPHAPQMPVTVNNGFVMPAWYDIHEFGTERKFNAAQLLASALAVHALIDREVERGIPADRIMLIGFSQGGAVNYQAGLTYDKPLAGMAALSTYFPTAEAIEVHPANAQLPIMICHGSSDDILPLGMAMNSKRQLERLNLAPEFYTYQMPHSVCPQEITDISAFIQKHL